MINVTASLLTHRHLRNQQTREVLIVLSAHTQAIEDRLSKKYGIDLLALGISLPKSPYLADIIANMGSSYLGFLSGIIFPLVLPAEAGETDFSQARAALMGDDVSVHISGPDKLLNKIEHDLPHLRESGLLDRPISHVLLSTSQSCEFVPILAPLDILQRAQSELYDMGGATGATLCVHAIKPGPMHIAERERFEKHLREAPDQDSVISTWTSHEDGTTLRYSLAGNQVLLGGDVLFRDEWVANPTSLPGLVHIARTARR